MYNFKIKLIEDGKMPSKVNSSDAGFDCYVRAIEPIYTEGKKIKVKYIKYKLGFAMEMPEGWAALLFQRSSIFRYDLILSNCVGVIDSGYRDELCVIFRPTKNKKTKIYEIGERVCQLIPYKLPEVELSLVEELNMTTNRGGGLGSTGK